MAGLPVIDLQLAAAAPEEAARLGCFRVALQDDMKAAVRALFDLPDDAKRRNADVISGSGYVAPSATNPLYEAFGLYDAASPADVDAFCSSLHAPPHIRETIRRYAEKTHELIVDVVAKLAASLGLEESESARLFQDWPCQFRINRYNYTPDTVGETGVQVHTDSGFLTVLHEDDCVGGPGHRRVRARGPSPRHLPRQPRRRRHGTVRRCLHLTSLRLPRLNSSLCVCVCVCVCVYVEQWGAAQREAPRAVRGGRAARLHRALLAGTQGRRGPRAGRLRQRRQPPSLQDFLLRRPPPPSAVHRRACRRGPGAVGRVIHQLKFEL